MYKNQVVCIQSLREFDSVDMSMLSISQNVHSSHFPYVGKSIEHWETVCIDTMLV